MGEKRLDSNLGGNKIHTDQTGIWRITDVMISRYQLAQEKLISAVDENNQRMLLSSYLAVVGLMQTVLPFILINDSKIEREYKKDIEDLIEELGEDVSFLLVKSASDEIIVHQILGQQKLIGESIKQMSKLGILVERNIVGDTGGYNLD